MKQIRNGVFETNSSSTHSICISKNKVSTYPSSVYFGFGEYGWENDTVDDTASYLYTGIMENEMSECIDKIKSILDRHNISYTFERPRKVNGYFDSGYVDHCGELRDFIEDVCNDEDKLLRYLFGDSVIYTGNDNSSEYEDPCNSADDYIWDDDGNKVPNPNPDEEHYEYYYKGN